LFLDYDGTLAGFAPTPDHILPDRELIALLTGLLRSRAMRLAIVSGRRLSHIRELLPLEGMLLAGSYGLEMITPEGLLIENLPYAQVRPVIEQVKPRFEALLEGKEGFYLEDKGWSLAIHARFAGDVEAGQVIEQARTVVQQAAKSGNFQVLGGHKFLEIGPSLANKGQAVELILADYPFPGSLPVYIGDDDKDEAAYQVTQARGGVALHVAEAPRPTLADYRLASPEAVRRFLVGLIDRFPFNRNRPDRRT
jgi:trehalose 6-phosphate phosphatase